VNFVGSAAKDLAVLINAFSKGERFGLARYGDGEEAMIFGKRYHCTDGWVSDPKTKKSYPNLLAKSMLSGHPRLHLGIRVPRGLPRMLWYWKNIQVSPDRICDPCLFVNSRWASARKFFKGIRKRCFLVGSGSGVDFKIPHNCISPEYNFSPLLKKLLGVKKPILLAAGPLANILVWKYLESGGKQTIIDIGTVLDMELFGRPSRGYMRKALSRRKGKGKPKKRAKKKAKRRKKRQPRRPAKRKRPTARASRMRRHLRAKQLRQARRRHK